MRAAFYSFLSSWQLLLNDFNKLEFHMVTPSLVFGIFGESSMLISAVRGDKRR